MMHWTESHYASHDVGAEVLKLLDAIAKNYGVREIAEPLAGSKLVYLNPVDLPASHDIGAAPDLAPGATEATNPVV